MANATNRLLLLLALSVAIAGCERDARILASRMNRAMREVSDAKACGNALIATARWSRESCAR